MTDFPIEITSDWGRIFGLVWHNPGSLDPRGLVGWIDVSSRKTWVLFPKTKFPFFSISYWRLCDD
jgi:hypothetical protein